MRAKERPSPRSIDEALTDTLESHPHAALAAVGPDGLFVPVPGSVAIGEHPVLEARAGIELVAAEYRSAVLQQFLELPEVGASTLDVLTLDGRAATYHLFDSRPSHGVFLLVFVATEAPVDAAAERPATISMRPRYARIWRTELADVLRIDDAATEMLGLTLEDYQQQDASSLIHPDDQAAAVGNWFDVISSPPGTARRWRGRALRHDGTWTWVEFTNTNRLDDPDEPHVLSELVDISDEMRAAEEVWESRELLRRLTDALPLGVVQFGADGRLQYVNDRMYSLLGIERDGDLYDQVAHVHPDDLHGLLDAIGIALSGGPDVDVDVRFRGPGVAGTRYLQLALRALRDRLDEVNGAIVTFTDVTDATLMRQELEERATFDDLTGCHNRASVLGELEATIAAASDGTGMALIYADLDGFKSINDRAVHHPGARILRIAAARLRGAVRAGDIVGRVGGDEFVVVCPDLASPEMAEEIADRIARTVAGPVRVGSGVETIELSLGVTWTRAPVAGGDILVASADAAMYDAKRRGPGAPVLTTLQHA